jgi:hypothetical protein
LFSGDDRPLASAPGSPDFVSDLDFSAFRKSENGRKTIVGEMKTEKFVVERNAIRGELLGDSSAKQL